MQIRDGILKKKIEVSRKECPTFECYWPRLDPGSFTQGIGYTHRSNNWICGRREINGCPLEPKVKPHENRKSVRKKDKSLP